MELTRYGQRVLMRCTGNGGLPRQQDRLTFFVYCDKRGRYCLLRRAEARFFKSEIRETLWPENEEWALGEIAKLRICKKMGGVPRNIIRLRGKDNPVVIDTQRLPVDVVIIDINDADVTAGEVRRAMYSDEPDVDRIMQLKPVWLARADMVKLTTSVKMRDIIVDVINALP